MDAALADQSCIRQSSAACSSRHRLPWPGVHPLYGTLSPGTDYSRWLEPKWSPCISMSNLELDQLDQYAKHTSTKHAPGGYWRILAAPGASWLGATIIISSPTPQEGGQGVGAERIIFSQGCPDASWPLPVRLVGPVGLVRPVGLDSLAPLPPTCFQTLILWGSWGGYGSMVPQWGGDQSCATVRSLGRGSCWRWCRWHWSARDGRFILVLLTTLAVVISVPPFGPIIILLLRILLYFPPCGLSTPSPSPQK